MQVIIPAAGYATRLYPLTLDKPKALLEVKGKPVLEHIIKRIEALPDAKNIFIVSNARFFPVFAQWLGGFKSKIPVKLLNDNTTSNEDRLGQIGDIQLAIEKFDVKDNLLIIAGDNLFNFSLVPVYDFFKKKKAIVNALFDIKSKEAASKLGVMAIDEKTGLVVSFEEKPAEPKSTTVSLGIYFFPKAQVSEIKKFLAAGGKPDKIGYLMAELAAQKKLFGMAFREKWFDIGTMEALEQARKEFVP